MALPALQSALLQLVATQEEASAGSSATTPDVAQLLRDFPGFISEHWPWLVSRAAIVLVTLFAFWILGRLAKRVVRRAAEHGSVRSSQLLEDTLVSMTGKGIMVLGLVVALSLVGVHLGPVLAGLGIAGFVLGFALQDSLSNFAAGAMILAYAPFDVGDAVEVAGVTGKVAGMSLVTTTLLTFDNQRMIIPNGKIWGDVIKNITAESIRRIDLVFGIGYGDDIPQAEAILHRIVEQHPGVLDEPAPVIKLSNLGDSSVDFIVRPWCATADYWEVRWDILRQVKLTFDQEGVTIPFPQRDVHLHTAGRREAPAEAMASGGT
ncbi:MAG: mechanosensitive ion channel family protein [Gemmatimonadota bacterium]